MTAPEADLTGWTAAPFTAAGFTHDVYRKGEGPGVVLIPEMPGMHPGVLALGNHLVDNGFTVACAVAVRHAGCAGVRPGAVPVMLRGCVAKEFAAFATNADRPVAHYLRALARDLNEKTPGKGVGVIGECFTGGFALAAAVDDSVLAPVLSQPSLPFPLTPKQRPRSRAVRSRAEDRRTARRQRGTVRAGPAVQRGRAVAGRTVQDAEGASRRRVRGHRDQLEEGQRARVRPDGALGADPGGARADGHPAYEARKRVVEFLTSRLT